MEKVGKLKYRLQLQNIDCSGKTQTAVAKHRSQLQNIDSSCKTQTAVAKH